MSRKEARVFTRIWNDPAFVQLPSQTQRLYLLLLSQPDLNYAGVLPFTPLRWALLCPDRGAKSLLGDVKRLATGGFVVVNRHTQEVLVRSFVQNDAGLVAGNHKLIDALIRDYESIRGDDIRAALLSSLRKGHPELVSQLENRVIPTSQSPITNSISISNSPTNQEMENFEIQKGGPLPDPLVERYLGIVEGNKEVLQPSVMLAINQLRQHLDEKLIDEAIGYCATLSSPPRSAAYLLKMVPAWAAERGVIVPELVAR